MNSGELSVGLCVFMEDQLKADVDTDEGRG